MMEEDRGINKESGGHSETTSLCGSTT